MKIRNGFVSNSSSSSFVLVSKNKKPLNEVLKEFNVCDSHPLASPLNNAFVRIMEYNAIKVESLEEYIKYYHSYDSLEDFLKDYKVDSVEELLKTESYLDIVIEMVLRFPDADVYHGAFASYGESAFETFMADTQLNHESDELIFNNSGSY